MTKRKIEYWVIPHDPDCPVVCMGEQPVQLPDPDSACRTVESPTLSPFSPKSPRGLLEQSRHGGPSIGNSQSTQLATKRSVSTPIVRLDRAIGLPDDIGWERQTGLVQTWRSTPRGSVVESIFNLFVKFGCQQYDWFVGQIGVGLRGEIGWESQIGFVQTWRSTPRGTSWNRFSICS